MMIEKRAIRNRAVTRLLTLGVLTGVLLLTSPKPVMACSGGGSFQECKGFWLDEFFAPCLATYCAGLQGTEYSQCRAECWDEYVSLSHADCQDCPL